MKYLVVIASILFYSSCSSSRAIIEKTYETIHYKEKKIVGGVFVRLNYLFDIPKGSRIHKEYSVPGDDYAVEYRLTYPDSTTLYISSSTLNGSRLNYENRFNAGIKRLARSQNDTLHLGGIQKNGKYWRENVSDEIIAGYINVDKQSREKFDKALASVRLARKKYN